MKNFIFLLTTLILQDILKLQSVRLLSGSVGVTVIYSAIKLGGSYVGTLLCAGRTTVMIVTACKLVYGGK